MEGVKIRSRAKWIEEGEKPSRFFFKLENSKFEKCRIESVSDSSGKEVFTQKEIANAHVDFYSDFFYEVCLKVVNSLIGIFSHQDWFDFDFSTKQCYKVLLRQNSSPPILHRSWSSFVNSGFNLDQHWSFVRDQFSEKYKNDLVWLTILRTVKVHYSLKHWGYIDNDKCAICSRVETIDHCFLNCARAKMVWAHFQSALSLLIGSPFLRNCVSVFFFQRPIIDAKNA